MFTFNGVQTPVDDDVAPLFRGFTIGGRRLGHNITMDGQGPTSAPHADYAQRASRGGFMLSEGTSPSATGFGEPNTPGIFTADQAAAWRPITAAVKAKGAVFFCQLWHVGRTSHTSFQPVAPCGGPITSRELLSACGENVAPSTPRALRTDEMARRRGRMAGVVEDYTRSARNALAAGFDGVEVHAANGYLLQQFLSDSTNDRRDAYGGPVPNRCRLLLEVACALCAAVGAANVGVRLGPFNTFNDCTDSDPFSLYGYLPPKLSDIGIAYVHLIRARHSGGINAPESTEAARASDTGETVEIRRSFNGPAILAGGFDAARGAAALRDGGCEAVAYGRWYLANPDLPLRFARKAPLNKYKRELFYASNEPVKGYTDCPFLGQEQKEGVPAADPYPAGSF